MTGCRARIRTWAKGSKVPCATTTQLGTFKTGAKGRKGRADPRILAEAIYFSIRTID